MVENFIKSSDPSDMIVLKDRLRIQQCFYHFKSVYKNIEKKKGSGGGGASLGAADTSVMSQSASPFQKEKNYGNTEGKTSEDTRGLKEEI